MTSNERLPIPEGPDNFSPDDFATATDRVRAVREQALQNPRVQAVVEEKLARIRRRVSTLAALRKARGLTQMQLVEELGMTQGEISRLERRDNLHLTTLSRFVEATGGQLRIVAVYDNEEVEVSIGDLAEA